MKSEEIRQKYDETAAGYDWKIAILERISGAHRLRQDLLKKREGRFLMLPAEQEEISRFIQKIVR